MVVWSSIGVPRCSRALALGAERVDYLGPSVASSDRDGLACALRSTEPGGTCTSVGIYFGEETRVHCSTGTA